MAYNQCELFPNFLWRSSLKYHFAHKCWILFYIHITNLFHFGFHCWFIVTKRRLNDNTLVNKICYMTFCSLSIRSGSERESTHRSRLILGPRSDVVRHTALELTQLNRLTYWLMVDQNTSYQGLTFYTVSLWILNINIEIILARVCAFKFNFWHVYFKHVFTNFWFLLWEDVFISNANIYSDSSLIRTLPILLRGDVNNIISIDSMIKIGIIFALTNEGFWKGLWRIFVNNLMIKLHTSIETKVRKMIRSAYKGIMLIYRSKQNSSVWNSLKTKGQFKIYFWHRRTSSRFSSKFWLRKMLMLLCTLFQQDLLIARWWTA